MLACLCGRHGCVKLNIDCENHMVCEELSVSKIGSDFSVGVIRTFPECSGQTAILYGMREILPAVFSENVYRISPAFVVCQYSVCVLL